MLVVFVPGQRILPKLNRNSLSLRLCFTKEILDMHWIR